MLVSQLLVAYFRFTETALALFLVPKKALLQKIAQPEQGPMLWFLNIFAKKFSEKIGVFDSKQS
jgi:hypothetical protein